MTIFRTPFIAGVAALLASSAAAQTTTAQGTTMGRDWDAPMVDTFFNPGGSMTLRANSEIRSSWDSLSEQQKQQVRDDCAAFGTQGAGASPAGGAGATDPASADAGANATTGTGGTAGTDMTATGTAGPADGAELESGGAASPIGQPTGEQAAQADSTPTHDTTGHPDTKVSTVGESDATTDDMGTTAGPGTSDERVTAVEQAMRENAPQTTGTGATTNPPADGATVGSGAGSVNASNTADTGAQGSPATPGTQEFDSASVSLTSWTQICQMVESF
ncbi:hypothetical protein ORIO_05915 [Cereibacter azotoformans]|uniref:Uncharacterized protein n=1 Tax=Cereibacter sphaeroides (strain ATCC 17025 / ATH 2.4.3) TaxID=349102 RepID=A4WRV0_CERS5|nr:hypothetical protein [Cereibacter azotoformans]ULB09462.1 hypothetical protein ORIO_05915 [Cereibacter azotoformans]